MWQECCYHSFELSLSSSRVLPPHSVFGWIFYSLLYYSASILTSNPPSAFATWYPEPLNVLAQYPLHPSSHLRRQVTDRCGCAGAKQYGRRRQQQKVTNTMNGNLSAPRTASPSCSYCPAGLRIIYAHPQSCFKTKGQRKKKRNRNNKKRRRE